MQYATPFNCPECGESTFETDETFESQEDLAGATCTNCGHVFEQEEIASQAKTMPKAALQKMIADADALRRKYAGH